MCSTVWMKMRGTLSAYMAVCLVLVGASVVMAQAESVTDTLNADAIKKKFQAADTNRDQKISLEEYQALPGDPRALARDFKLFDFNSNRSLDREEFAAIPGWVPAEKRGPLPDPLDDLLQQAITAMDAAYGDWDKAPARQFNSQIFAQSFVISLAPSATTTDRNVPVTSSQLEEFSKAADQNKDGQISRQEAGRFLELQLGIIRADNHKTRLPNGRVLQFSRFLNTDHNRDNKLTKDEFLSGWGGDDLEAVFAAGDKNHDGMISIGEFQAPNWVGFDDPIVRFLQADQDFDGECTREELKTVTTPDQLALIPLVMAAMDEDGNGKLSLREFRLSPLGNKFSGLEAAPVDGDRDRKLSFSEFRYRGIGSHLLHRVYFHRFDVNQDGFLTEDEFYIHYRQPDQIYHLSEDGREFHAIYTNAEYPSCGSPGVSNDGQQVLFDTWKGGETFTSGRIFQMPITGKTGKDLCDGLMPSWSGDGKQFACSRNGQGNADQYGIWIMNADGTPFHKISRGWGAQWSPDGKTIVFTQNGGVSVFDVATREIREVATSKQIGVDYVMYNMSWTPDSSRIAFHARLGAHYVIASIAMTGTELDPQIHLDSELGIENDVAWSNDGKRILFNMIPEKGGSYRLHQIDAVPNATPRRVQGVPEDLMTCSVTRIPGGQGFLVFSRDR